MPLYITFLLKITLSLAFVFYSAYCFASGNETSAGVVVSMYQPDYGKFGKLTKDAGQPEFQSSMLLYGGDVTFMRRNFFTGGRILYGSTSSVKDSTSSSTYQIENIGLKLGVGFGSAVDFKTGLVLGIGEVNYNYYTAASSGGVNVEYLFLEPFATIGLVGARTFKLSVGAGYHYGMPYKVTSFGTTLLANPSSDATVGGINILLQLSFGDFASGSST